MTDFAIREVSPTASIPVIRRLGDQTVLIPRGGRFAEDITNRLTTLGARTVVAPVVNFASADDASALQSQFDSLAAGSYDWIVLTSATTVDVLQHHKVEIPERTRVAAIGETTAQALLFANIRVDFVPPTDNSSRGFISSLPGGFTESTILVPHSETSEPILAAGFDQRGIDATFVSAYRTVGVPIPADVRARVHSGDITAILVSSGSVARQLAEQLSPIPKSTAVICIGPRTTFDAQQAGLSVSHTAAERSNEALIDALLEFRDA
ncbi:MAG: uroporphyrinogen-III synthase [Microbacteriaceae bacterium]|nr:uroporphyrinogen-III synthase [Microbacteriaceae bacterium]